MNYKFEIKTKSDLKRAQQQTSPNCKGGQSRRSIGLLHEVTGLNKIPLLVITVTCFQSHQNSNRRGTTSCRV